MGFAQHNKKDLAIVFLLALCGILIGYIALLPQISCHCNTTAEALVSPKAQDDIIEFIRSAKESIDIQMYILTSEEVMRELGLAAQRGVQVRIILEPRVEDARKQRVFSLLSASGCQVRWASLSYKLTHSKMIIIDKKKAIVGSINLSKSALTENREVAVKIEGKPVEELLKIFEEDWEKALGSYS